jgi:hypothetical protein
LGNGFYWIWSLPVNRSNKSFFRNGKQHEKSFLPSGLPGFPSG